MRSTLANGLGLMLFLNLPATIGLMVLARPIIAVIFEHGEFTAADTRRHGRCAAVLCDRPRRLFGRAHHLADVLRARAQPGAGDGVGASVVVNVVLNVMLVRIHGLSRPGARHVDHGDHQRRRAAVAAAP